MRVTEYDNHFKLNFNFTRKLSVYLSYRAMTNIFNFYVIAFKSFLQLGKWLKRLQQAYALLLPYYKYVERAVKLLNYAKQT